MSYSVKSIRKQFREHGVFYTDSRMADIIRSRLPEDVTEVYDPTCGNGNLLSAFPDEVRKYGQELDAVQAEEARRRLNNAEIAVGDTLQDPKFIGRRFMAIAANYPFSIAHDPDKLYRLPIYDDVPCLPSRSRSDYLFLLHILEHLAEEGTASVLNFPGVLYRGQREGKLRAWLVERNYVESVEQFEGGYFEDTKVETALLVLKKHRDRRTIHFRSHEWNVGRDVSLEEIKTNDYNLSVGLYVDKPVAERPKFDPFEAEVKARGDILRRLDAQLGFSMAAIELHKELGLPPLPPLEDFFKDVNRVISKYRKISLEDKRVLTRQFYPTLF